MSFFYISFALIFAGASAVLIVSLRPGRVSLPGVSIFIFSCLFYLVAPLIQHFNSPERLVNTGEFILSYGIYSNLIISSFLMIYALAYLSLTSGRRFLLYPELMLAKHQPIRKSFLISGLILCLSLMAVVFAFKGISNTIALLLIFKFFAMVVFFGVAVYLWSIRGRYSKSFFLLLTLGLYVLALIFLKNPLFERRNAIGPVYLTLFCLFLPVLLGKRAYLIFGFFFMMILFPASSILTHQYGVFAGHDVSFDQVLSQITGHYNDLHYDSWSNGITMFEIIGERGHGYGGQLLGALLFFVPRSFWNDKPVSSGEMVGQYLMENSTLWFSNLSFSYPYEFYFDFGAFGVVIGAVLLASVVVFLEFRARRTIVDQIFLIYFSFYIYFLMRGALLPAFAYLVPAYVACCLAGRFFISRKSLG